MTCGRAGVRRGNKGSFLSSSSSSEESAEGGSADSRRRVGKKVSYGMRGHKSGKAQKLDAVSRTLRCVLPKEIKAHRTPSARAELVLARLTAVRPFRLL